MGIWNLIKKLFHFGAIKVENGLSKLLDAEKQLEIAKHDALEMIEKQRVNSVELEKQKLIFEQDFDKAEKELVRYKTNCEVLKNKLVKEHKDPATDPDMQMEASNYMDQQRHVDSMKQQKEELDKMVHRVEMLLKRFTYNKQRIEREAASLKMQIQMYRTQASISANGEVDIERTFGNITELVNSMKFEQQAAQRVDDIVNHREINNLANEADVSNFINSL